MYERLRGLVPIVVIPGVTGMSGCWTAAGAPITLGDDVLTCFRARSIKTGSQRS